MKIFWILLICLGLRLISLDQSLWLDEAISANTARNYSFSEIITKFSPGDFHPPGYYLTLKTWTSIFGYSEISLRMPSVIFSLITIYIVYLLAGTAAAGLTGLNPLLLYYSQEARMYSMVVMLLTWAIYCLVKKKYWIYSILSFLCFTVFYGSIFLLAAMAIYLLVKKKYKEFLISNIGLILAVLMLTPLLKIQMLNSKEMLFEVKNWSLVLGKANLKNLLLIPIKFTSGRISFYPKIIYYLISVGWAIFVFKSLSSRCCGTLLSPSRILGPLKKGRLKNLSFYSYLFWMSLIIGVVFSIFTPMLQYFRFLYLIPITAILIGKNKIVAGGFLIFSLIYLLNSNYWREDWRSLSQGLGDKVYMIQSFADPVKYYRPDIMIYDLRNMNYESNKITVIPYGEEIHGVNHKNILEKAGYKLVNINNFREITSENWQLMP